MTRSEIEGENADIVIKIIGIGGAGSYFVENLIVSDLSGPNFIVANTAANDIAQSSAATKIQLRTGLGSSTKPSAVHSAVIQSRATIETVLADAHMLVILCSMSGITGSGASPAIAEISRSMGILTLAIVTWPFGFEGNLPRQLAAAGLSALANHVDSLFVTNQGSLVEPQGGVTEINTVFTQDNKPATTAVSGLIGLLLRAGLVCVDIEDARTAMSNQGFGAIGIANAFGEARCRTSSRCCVIRAGQTRDRSWSSGAHLGIQQGTT